MSQKPFIIGCRKVVLANGGSDLVNRLGVRGENKSLSWLKYELPLLETAIENVAAEQKSKTKVKRCVSSSDIGNINFSSLLTGNDCWKRTFGS